MPEMDGVQVCHELRHDTHLAAVPILFLSMRSSIEDRINGLNGGADDYLTKPFDFGELKARIKALIRRSGRSRTVTGPLASLLVYEDLQLDLRAHMVRVASESILLTPAEFDLLRHFMLHQGQVYSSAALLQIVFGYSCDSADQGLVRWHIRNLRRKIEPDPNHPHYIRTVPRHGYLMGDPSETG
jgi:DNA-binding response OmpR family regulator